LWHFIAFSAGTGGSMLVIGSAAGVVAMGMEKLDFFWYLKKISWLALIGFLVGSAAFVILRALI
jgi:Na+/H+ antiporter NhaD/arsenite permease-like protein